MRKFLFASLFFSSLFFYSRALADTEGNSTVVKLVVSNPQAVTSATPVGGIYTVGQSVSLSCTDTGGPGCGSTYYTLNGSVPTASSSIYVSPITISSDATLRYFSTDTNGIHGPAGSQTYVIDGVPPVTTAYPPAGDYSAAQSVTLSCTDDNSGCAATYYTTDGTVPTASSSQYSPSNPILITATTTVRFFSTDLAGNSELPQTDVYNISLAPLPPPPTGTGSSSPGSPPGGGSYSNNQTFIIDNVSVDAGTTSAIVSWDSNESAVSILSWESTAGEVRPGSSGSISEIVYATEHTVFIQNLRPNQEYTITVDAVSASGAVLHDSFFLHTLSVSRPPPDVTDFTAGVSLGGNVILSWNNPSISDFDSVLITSGTRFFPRDPQEGYIVYQGKGESALDFNAKPGSEYYYSAFTENTAGEYSPGVGTEFVSGTSSAQPIFGGTVSILPASSTDEIIFLNNSKALKSEMTGSSSSPVLSIVIDPDAPLTVIIPSDIVPRDTEEIIIKVSDTSGSASAPVFIFKKMSNGSYESTIPAFFDYENTANTSPFTISMLSVGYETRINGVFVIRTVNPSPSATTVHGNGYNFLLYLLLFILFTIALICMVFRISLSRKIHIK